MKNISTVLMVLVLVGCKTTGTLQPMATSYQKEIIRDGAQSLLSQKKHTVMVASNSEIVESSGRASFIVVVSNGSTEDFLFSPSNILATAKVPHKDTLRDMKANNNNDQNVNDVLSKVTIEQELHVYTYEELVKEEERRAAMEALALALGSVGRSMQASSAGCQSGYGTVNTYGTYGSSFGTYNYSGYNHAAANAARNVAQAQTNAEFSSAAAESQANRVRLKNIILKENTLLPSGSCGGIVEIQMPSFSGDLSSIPINIEVVADSEVHNFHYRFTRNP